MTDKLPPVPDEADIPPQNDASTDAGKLLADPEPLLTRLDHYGLLRVSGPDSRKFLQGQLTCNMDEVDTGQTLRGGVCSPKGRLYATFQVLAENADSVLLRLPSATIPGLVATLSPYSVFSQVTLEDVSEQLCCLGLLRPGTVTTAALPGLPAPAGAVSRRDQLNVIASDDHGDRFEIWLPTMNLAAFEQELAVHACRSGSDCWHLANIRAGIYDLTPTLVDQFIPQAINLELVGGVSFRKGCYTGQEIVARTQYRGQSKRRMFRFAMPCSAAPNPGTAIFAAESGRQTGVTLTAVLASSNNCELLAVMNCEAAIAGNNCLGSTDGPRLDLLELPYAII